MATLTYQTAGESHGHSLVAIVSGLPADLAVDIDFINAELARRQGGYGRSGRQRIESDRVVFLAGLRQGRTIGSPVAMQVVNKDHRIDDSARTPSVHRPRPGHADLAGSLKRLTTDCRDTLERASARETAARVAAGALARCLLREFGIEVFGFVRSIHDTRTDVEVTAGDWRELNLLRDASEVYCPDVAASERVVEAIRRAAADKDTVGGLVETHVFGCPPGLGSCMNWDERLDARLAAAVMGIQAFKGVEIGLGFEAARLRGSQVHDPIHYDTVKSAEPAVGFVRPTNHAGGLEGGMTNAMPIVVRGAMKPISTLLRGLPSIDLRTKQPETSQHERSDICAVPAASVVMENVVAFEVARALREKFGGDSMAEAIGNRDVFLEKARRLTGYGHSRA